LLNYPKNIDMSFDYVKVNSFTNSTTKYKYKNKTKTTACKFIKRSSSIKT